MMIEPFGVRDFLPVRRSVFFFFSFSFRLFETDDMTEYTPYTMGSPGRPNRDHITNVFQHCWIVNIVNVWGRCSLRLQSYLVVRNFGGKHQTGTTSNWDIESKIWDVLLCFVLVDRPTRNLLTCSFHVVASGVFTILFSNPMSSLPFAPKNPSC